ncbi:unnamed protein product [Penicillium egyptiacum]|uniref:EXPERA domain-containing protein n=1 Tax=Penicillium egyptiacum TaxID=1303716 RepID=A0A9W4KJY8_9EURO|nr:unnamed protein product [Penicillium egyptiacum]
MRVTMWRYKIPRGQIEYHSHSRATLLDGLYGALFIRRKPGTPGPCGKKKDPSDRSAYHPLLYSVNSPEARGDDLIIRTQNGAWQDIVLQVGHSPLWPVDFSHAVHKHANKFWRLGSGEGIWNYSSIGEAMADHPENFNLVNPPYRDTFIAEFTGAMWVVLRYQVTSPGAWLLHCHFEMHLENGMAMAILDGVDKWPEVPEEYTLDSHGFREEEKKPELQRGLFQVFDQLFWQVPVALANAANSVSHNYYPPTIHLPKYVDNESSAVSIIIQFGFLWAAVVGMAFVVICRLRPNASQSDKLAFVWMCLSSQELFGQLWKEYSLSDSRYLTSDAFLVCMEAVTAFCWGPLAFCIAYCIAVQHPARYALQLVISVGQVYGDVLYYATSLLEISYCRPERYYFWFYYFFFNFIWMLVGCYYAKQSISEITKAFGKLQEFGQKEQTNFKADTVLKKGD